jgi:hypothetical protein
MRFLNGRGKRSAFVILASGLCTFFTPIFSTTTSGVHRTGWSPWRIASQMNAQNVRPSDIIFNMTLSGLAVVYALMVCGLVAIRLSRPRKMAAPLLVIARTRQRLPWKKCSNRPCLTKWVSITWACRIKSRRPGKECPHGSSSRSRSFSFSLF